VHAEPMRVELEQEEDGRWVLRSSSCPGFWRTAKLAQKRWLVSKSSRFESLQIGSSTASERLR